MSEFDALPSWHGGDGAPMPWWVERGYHAWAVDYWRTFGPVPAKRSKRR